MTSLTRPARGALTAIALCLTVALTGCGGSDSDGGSDGDPTSEAAAITQDELIEQGNAICDAGNAEIEAAGAEVDTTDPAALEAAITDVVIPNIRGQIADLRALGYPEGDEDTLEDIYTGAEDALDRAEADPSLMTTGDGTLFADTNAALSDYGLTTCGAS